MNTNLYKKINVQSKQQLIKDIMTNQNARQSMYQINNSKYSKTNFLNNVQVIDHNEHEFNKFIKQLQDQGMVVEIQSPKSYNQNNQIEHSNQNENDFQTKQYFGKQIDQTIVQKLLTNSMKNFAIRQNQMQNINLFNSLELKKMNRLQKLKGELYYLKRLLFAIIQLVNQSRIEMQMYRKHIPINFNKLVQQYDQNQFPKTIILKQKITSLQRIIKQKDNQINSLIKQKQLLQYQNQKLNEDIFDMNQKVEQIDLRIQQSVKQIVKKKFNYQKKLNVSHKSQKSKFEMKQQKDYGIEYSKNNFQQRLQLQINSNKPIESVVSQNDFHPSRPILINQKNIIPPKLKYLESFQNSQLNILDTIYPKQINSRQLTPVPSKGSKIGLGLHYRSQSQSSILKNMSPKNNNKGSPKLSQNYCTLKNKSKPKVEYEKYEKQMIAQRNLNKSKNVQKINTLGARIEQLRNQIRKQIISSK